MDNETAFSQGLAYVESDGTVIMKGDDTNWLPLGTNRSRFITHNISNNSILIIVSVRIQSNAAYNGGLFILDLNMAPWGCGSYPVSI